MKHLFHPDRADIQLSTVLYALSDPVRLLIVSELYKGCERACGDFAVPVVKSTMSHHARTLREAGVINVRIHGTQRLISLRSEDLDIRFPGLLTSILSAYEASGEKMKLYPDLYESEAEPQHEHESRVE
ncbi:ArsR/SmtB family transcription factor [Paenibacillus sp. GCM10023248]|uniref:ArsR/SmtB family transcription factor n=1 Tax=unclassified Paenibacillus TaxID=185978 RepID=UPI0023791829|nr:MULTISPECIES: helix-turn-helix domain-containing protein [Bacillales]MDD9269085.1 helix-turn-helix domain-containing protein [Paenibacillus sp. MAHUQ-63]MDR6880694.1 DNA-binding transcriptional ArsR family regulator [Bacillus sp. 3255]